MTPAVNSSLSAQPSRRRLDVLVVDDNQDAADSLALLLRQDGHAVRVVYSGEDALDAARFALPALVILDIGLPGISGYDVAKQLRLDYTDQPLTIVAATGWGTSKDKEIAHRASFDRHLTKPVDYADIEDIIGELRRLRNV